MIVIIHFVTVAGEIWKMYHLGRHFGSNLIRSGWINGGIATEWGTTIKKEWGRSLCADVDRSLG